MDVSEHFVVVWWADFVTNVIGSGRLLGVGIVETKILFGFPKAAMRWVRSIF